MIEFSKMKKIILAIAAYLTLSGCWDSNAPKIFYELGGTGEWRTVVFKKNDTEGYAFL